MTPARLVPLALLLIALSPPVALEAAEPRAADPRQIPVVLAFEDRPVAQVLMGLFAAAGIRGDIDPCVSGRISITLKNATLGSALDAVARLADLEVRPGESPRDFRVSCRDSEARRARTRAMLRTGEAASLRFRIETIDPDGRSETVAEPRLIVPVGELAELAESAELPDYALADDGELIVTTTRPTWSLRMMVVPARGTPTLELRGILEVSSKSSREPEAGVATMTQPFRGALTGERETPLASAQLGATTWVLRLVE